MKYKLIASDFDMTLTRKDRVITDRTKNAIKNFTSLGGKFSICSTRPFFAINCCIDGLEISSIIANQGASIFDLKTGERIYKNFLKKEEVFEIVSYFKNLSKHIFLFNDKKAYCKGLYFFERVCNSKVHYNLTPIGDKIFNYYPEDDGVAQIIVGAGKKQVLKLLQQARQHFDGKYEVSLCDKYMLNVTPLGVTKGSGIKNLCEYYGITKQQAVAFGDSDNDAPMYESVAIGVAMGNAMEGLKKQATEVCDSCDDDGLAKYIEQKVLNS